MKKLFRIISLITCLCLLASGSALAAGYSSARLKDVAKVQATRIYEKDNYVCYICIGSISRDISESGDEAKQVAAYKAENEKAVKAIKKLF